MLKRAAEQIKNNCCWGSGVGVHGKLAVYPRHHTLADALRLARQFDDDGEASSWSVLQRDEAAMIA